MPNQLDLLTKKKAKEFGIYEGATVLDFGCGVGATSFILSDLVGPEGLVIGFDLNKSSIEQAKHNAKEQKVDNVKFVSGDLKSFMRSYSLYFDRVFGRRVLMYIKDVTEVLQSLKATLKPNGLMIFQEHDGNLSTQLEGLPMHNQIRNWCWETIRREGGNVSIGKNLWRYFTDTGLLVENFECISGINHPERNSAFYIELVGFMRNRMIKSNVIQNDELGVEGLESVLFKERSSSSQSYCEELAYWVVAKNKAI